MSGEILAFVLLFARIGGFFVVSPLFSGRAIPIVVRFGLAIVCSLLIAPPLSTQLTLKIDQPVLFAIQFFKELSIGYLLGFLFSLLFEAAAFAGQVVGTLMGFSATELLDPLATSAHPLLGRAFSLILFTLFLSLDLHHPLLRLLFESFEALPIHHSPFSHQTILHIIQASSKMFQIALELAIFPMLVLLMLISLFAVLSRFFPIFWIGFPIQLLVGMTTLALTVKFFAPILERGFYQFWEVGKNLFFQL